MDLIQLLLAWTTRLFEPTCLNNRAMKGRKLLVKCNSEIILALAHLPSNAMSKVLALNCIDPFPLSKLVSVLTGKEWLKRGCI